ncbi:calcium/proton exchanger [Evansella cellulosilytica]|uniref:Ca(2+)/H(+) antiporter n=1 Tax=Evansella cellulosilytica (strain ATCC 21833 / DSM 2522 / FERM P-1141 / JCM 9156 / N-4) TaxID=649639 RepID=E6U010_EVAC2|nr:calcium/proton exchanger [Evansella cellulosilytica]ADU29014.1 calcium/proton antiporter, CaCA family [Evansella cellulosilytica DSM 2522]
MLYKIFLIMTVVGVPISIVGSLLNWAPTIMFAIYALTILALASYIGRATESLSIIAGPRIGGLLNVTFGNAVELTISIFALKAGYLTIVLASLTGAVISNLLLVAGLSFFIGGLKFKRQSFNIHDARHNMGLLMFSVVVSFVFPFIFSFRLTENEIFTLSVGIAIVMLLLYFAALFFRLVTHRGVYVQGKENEEEEEPEWGKKRSIIVLAAAALSVAFLSDQLVDSFEGVAASFGWSEVFIGVIVVAIIGNSAENITAILMAVRNKVNVSMEIAVGSTLQIAMFVTPLLVVLSLIFANPLSLVFQMEALVAMVLSVFLINMIINDGDTNWFEGLTLLSAYIIMAIGFYFM